MRIGNREVGPGNPIYLVAEIGGNHNSDVATALHLIDAARAAGADAVKFQKRAPDACVPEHVKGEIRDTPWGPMTYIDYRHKLEFGRSEYKRIAKYCKSIDIDWFVSVWDAESVEFMEQYDPIAYKVGSPCLTDERLLEAVAATERPLVLSTGMSAIGEIHRAISRLGYPPMIICQCTSSYPCPPAETNLRMLSLLQGLEAGQPGYPVVGYSGHELGYVPTIAAAALGVSYIERHFTLDKSWWGSDQAISLEPDEFAAMVKAVREVEEAMGDGVKRVYDSERKAMSKLRRYITEEVPVAT